jgi:hypothetical protein
LEACSVINSDQLKDCRFIFRYAEYEFQSHRSLGACFLQVNTP